MGRKLLSLLAAAASGAGLLAAPGTAGATHGYDMDCGNFGSQAAAQYHMNAHPGDPDRLDGNDDDGRACESNPCPCDYGPGTSPQQPYALPPEPSPAPAPAPTPAPTPAPAATAKTHRGKVVSVVDGDTLKVRLRSGRRRTVRLIGIDTPEVHKPGIAVECGARKASAYMTRLAQRRRPGRRGHDVRLRTDPTQATTDQFGRLLAYVTRDSDRLDLGRAMVRAGWATTYVYDSRPFERFGTYSRAEARAKSSARGVHGLCAGDFHSEQP